MYQRGRTKRTWFWSANQMNNKIILLWAICLIALGIVSKLASDDIKKQYETERARAEKDNFGR